MFGKLGATVLLCLFLSQSDGCGSRSGGDNQNSKPASAQATPTPAPAAGSSVAQSPSGACLLIEKSEIESLQGAQMRGSEPSTGTEAGMAFSDCYYTVISSDGSKNLSVHLRVLRDEVQGAGQGALKAFWGERFQGAKEKKKAEKPRAVADVGDEAYWLGNNVMGALYVLAKDRIVRVSVGGAEEVDAKVEKSRRLAEKAIQRLE
jgi:hypothetical protein